MSKAGVLGVFRYLGLESSMALPPNPTGLTRRVPDWEHEPTAKHVPDAAVLGSGGQACGHNLLLLVPLGPADGASASPDLGG